MYAILMRSDGTKQLSVAATRKHGCARTVVVCHFPWALILYYDRSTICLLTRAVASGGGTGGSCPPSELLSQTNQVCGWICSLYTQLF